MADELVGRFEYPTPRVEFGSVARGIASAAMDLSDGLAGDLPKFAKASGLAAHVDVERLPLSPALQSMVSTDQAREWALAAGEIYSDVVTNAHLSLILVFFTAGLKPSACAIPTSVLVLACSA